MAPVYSRVCRKTLGDMYLSRQDSQAHTLWTDALPKKFADAWGLKRVELPKGFDFEKCSKPVVDGLYRRGLLEREPEPEPRGHDQVVRAMPAGPGPEDEREPFDRREAMRMLDRRLAAVIADRDAKAPPKYSSKFCPGGDSIVLRGKPRKISLFCPYLFPSCSCFPFLPRLLSSPPSLLASHLTFHPRAARISPPLSRGFQPKPTVNRT